MSNPVESTGGARSTPTMMDDDAEPIRRPASMGGTAELLAQVFQMLDEQRHGVGVRGQLRFRKRCRVLGQVDGGEGLRLGIEREHALPDGETQSPHGEERWPRGHRTLILKLRDDYESMPGLRPGLRRQN